MGCESERGNTQERKTERVVVCIKQSNQIGRKRRGERTTVAGRSMGTR